MARPRTRPIIQTNCAHCGLEITVVQDTQRPNNNRFCSMDHRNLYKIGKKTKEKWTVNQILDEYKRLTADLGHYPSFIEVKEHGQISVRVFQNRYGTLDNVRKMAFPESDFNALDDNWNIDSISDEDGGWLAGMCNGEACFRIDYKEINEKRVRMTAVFSINLRADDAECLNEMKNLWAIKNPLILWDRRMDTSRGMNVGDGLKLHVRDIPTLHRKIIPTLEKYKLRGKKGNEIPLFKRAVDIMYNKRSEGRRYASFTSDEKVELKSIYWSLREMKKYKSNGDEVLKNYPAIRINANATDSD